MREWFRRGPREPRQEPAADRQTGAEVAARPIPENLWTRCPSCKELNYSREFEKCLKVCQTMPPWVHASVSPSWLTPRASSSMMPE